MSLTGTVVRKLGSLQDTATVDMVRNSMEGKVTVFAAKLGLAARAVPEWELVKEPAQLTLHIGFTKSRSAAPFSVSSAHTYMSALFGSRAEFSVESDATFKLILPCPEMKRGKGALLMWGAAFALLLLLIGVLLLVRQRV